MGAGLTEASRCCGNDLRKRAVQTDGGLKTGLDVIKAAILGRRKLRFWHRPDGRAGLCTCASAT